MLNIWSSQDTVNWGDFYCTAMNICVASNVVGRFRDQLILISVLWRRQDLFSLGFCSSLSVCLSLTWYSNAVDDVSDEIAPLCYGSRHYGGSRSCENELEEPMGHLVCWQSDPCPVRVPQDGVTLPVRQRVPHQPVADATDNWNAVLEIILDRQSELCISFTNSVLTSKETQRISVSTISWLILFNKMIAVRSDKSGTVKIPNEAVICSCIIYVRSRECSKAGDHVSRSVGHVKSCNGLHLRSHKMSNFNKSRSISKAT